MILGTVRTVPYVPSFILPYFAGVFLVAGDAAVEYVAFYISCLTGWTALQELSPVL